MGGGGQGGVLGAVVYVNAHSKRAINISSDCNDALCLKTSLKIGILQKSGLRMKLKGKCCFSENPRENTI